MLSVPYIISGPDIGKEVVPYALAEDIGATIFNLLEIEPDYELDGRSLID
jgi:hypothetical protein